MAGDTKQLGISVLQESSCYICATASIFCNNDDDFLSCFSMFNTVHEGHKSITHSGTSHCVLGSQERLKQC